MLFALTLYYAHKDNFSDMKYENRTLKEKEEMQEKVLQRRT